MGNSIDMQFISKTTLVIAILEVILFMLISFTTDIPSELLGFIIGAILCSLPHIPKIIDPLNRL